MRTISTTQAYVEGEYYRVLVATEDSTLSATSMVGDDLASIDVYAGTTIYGLFTAVTVTAGEVTAYLAGRTDIDDVWAYIRAYGEAGGATIEGEDCAKAAISRLLDKYYAQASLVMVPSLYKTSIVYSERPLSTDGELTFTRASSATRIAPNGLIEKVRTNLLLQSNSFDTTWSSSSTTETSGQSGYDGTTNAWLLAASSAGGFIFQDVTIAGLVTFSIYAKAGSEIGITLYSTHASQGRYFNLSTGALGGTFIGAPLDSKIESIGSGWYRCSITVSATATNNFRVYVSNGTANVTGNILIQSAQVEAGDIATDYIPTTTVAVSVGPVANLPRLNYPINSDGSVGCPSLLLEPQRTNLVLWSEQFDNAAWTENNTTISANATTSPDGYVNADKLVEAATTSTHLAYTQVTTTATEYSFSVFAKAGERRRVGLRDNQVGNSAVFDLVSGTVISGSGGNIVAAANGFYRITLTGLYNAAGTRHEIYVLEDTATVANTSYTGDGTSGIYIWGAQLEAGDYATSYIPTLGAAVTRLADACSKTGISSLIGQTEGTLYLEADIVKKNETEFYYAISAGAILGDSIYIHQVSQEIFVNKRIGGVTQNLIVSSANWNSGNNKIAVKYTASEMKIFINGVLKDTEAISGLPSSFSMLTIGSRQDLLGSLASDAKYKQALLFPTALTDAQCIELTTL